MGKSISKHLKKSKGIICEEGIATFIRKAYSELRLILDIYVNRSLSHFYIKGFHKLYYYSAPNTWQNTYWMGIPAQKCPLDLWIYEEVIYETKPSFIIETGTANGGSALFFASICDLIGKGKVITIDISECDVSHRRITKVVGDSVSKEVINQVKDIVGNKPAMVILDSDHHKNHVLEEMELYSEFVSVGNYLVVEDANINGHPVLPGWGGGPMEAVEEFIKCRQDFEIDKAREKFLLTFLPKGFLRRIK